MRLIKYTVTLLCIFFSLNIKADTCSYKEQTILNNDFSNVKITYDIVNDTKINILIYNLTENIYFTFENPDTEEEQSIYFNDTINGKYIIERNTNNLEEYKFIIRSNIPSCFGNILTTKAIIKPKYNEYHTLDICNNKKLINHSYCQKYITKDITISENSVIKELEDYLKVHVDIITTMKKVENEQKNIKPIIKYSIVGVVVIIIVVIIFIINKKRGEL